MARFHHQLGGLHPSPPPQQQLSFSVDEELEEEEKDEEEEFPISSPLIVPGPQREEEAARKRENPHPLSLMAVLVAALRKSLVMCSVGADEEGGMGYRRTAPAAMEIGWPTDVRHVAHVTFDRFGGFLGLPVELEPEVPRRVPSASVSVFGVSAESMQCSYDDRGNSVPTILLSMQRHLYSEGGLQVEGIFRINAEDGQEVLVRDELNKGTVPQGIDLHCLAGLIKAWFRELPKGVLDSLTPDQVMDCNTEEACSELVRMLPPTEAALLDWAVNLMADVVEHERHNKMNARNIAMVFAPNMTQMADPLTALIHAVQVMNFLKMLIVKMLRERDVASFAAKALDSCLESPREKDESRSSEPLEKYHTLSTDEKAMDVYDLDKVAINKFLLNAKQSLGIREGCFAGFEKKSQIEEQCEFVSSKISTLDSAKDECKCEFVYGDVESAMDGLSFREGVMKICRHTVFQLSRTSKKSTKLVGADGGRETWT